MVEGGAKEDTEKEGSCYCAPCTLILNLLFKKKKKTHNQKEHQKKPCIKSVQVRFIFSCFL